MFTIDVDLREYLKHLQEVPPALKKAAETGVRDLTAAIHAHALEESKKKLHTRAKMFADHLKIRQVDDDTWLVVLEKEAVWIEDGVDPHEMIDDLLSKRSAKSSPPKRAKDGSLYRVIPFHHGPGKGPTQSTPAEATLQATIKKALKTAENRFTGKAGIPYGGLEKDDRGVPRTGLLHKLDIMDQPKKTHEGPGMGKGPLGEVRQGPTGIPFLQGIRIYQRETQNPDGSKSVKRAIMTFRVVSSKHKGTGRWFHPGLPPTNILEEAYRWGLQHLDTVIIPKILDQVLGPER